MQKARLTATFHFSLVGYSAAAVKFKSEGGGNCVCSVMSN